MSKKSFETLEKELEELIAKLECSDISLEEASEAYEKGVLILQEAQNALNEASGKIMQLMDTVNGVIEKPIKITNKK